MEEVADPEVLKAFGMSGAAPADESGLEEVSDPQILQAFEANTRGAAKDDPNRPIERGNDAGIKAAYVKGFSSDENETVRYLAKELYPKEPIDQAVKRFGNRDGSIYHLADDGKYYEALPGEQGWGPRDMAGWAAQGVGPALPMVSGAAAGIATAPAAVTGVGLLGSMAAAGAGGVAGEAARQKIGDEMMGEASTGDLNVRSMASEGVTNALGQGIGSGISMALTKNAVRDINKLNPAQTQQAYDEAANAGVWITPAEATGLPSLAAQQKRLTNITPTADEMRTFLDTRDQQVVGAWSSYLDNISPAADAEDVGRLGRTAAHDVLEGMRQANLTLARPYYQQAFQEGDRVIWSQELQRLAGAPSVVSAMRGAVRTWQDNAIADGFGAFRPGAMVEGSEIRFMGGRTGIPAMPNLQFWDYTKRMLDDRVRTALQSGQRDKARVASTLVRRLRMELDNLSATGDVPRAYAQARAIYGSGAEEITNATQSALGILADTADTNVLAAARHVFNPTTRSPQMVTTLRRAIEEQDPAAWQGLKRLYMQDVTLGAMRVSEQGGVINPAGKLHKAFIDPRVRANLRAAMTPEEWTRMNDLLVVFKRAASVPGMRSDTEFNRLMTNEAAEAARPLLAKITKNANPAEALRSASEWMTNRSLERSAKRAVDLITSGDPQAINAMKELKRLSPMNRNWLAVFGHLVGRGGAEGAEELSPNANYGPSAQPQ